MPGRSIFPLIAHAGGADESLSVAMLAAALWLVWAGRRQLRDGGSRARRRLGFALFGAAAALAVGAAWLPSALVGPGPAPGGARPASTATLAFLRPSEGETLARDQVEVVLDLQGGTVVDRSTPVTPDTGHVHLTVDGKMVSMTYGTVQVVNLGPYEPGPHVMEAEFVAADHLPFGPPVVARVTFVIPEGG